MTKNKTAAVTPHAIVRACLAGIFEDVDGVDIDSVDWLGVA